MTLIEVLVAIAIASGVLATAIETYRFASLRSVVYGMDLETVDLAASLLARADKDVAIGSHQSSAFDGGSLSWSIDGRRIGTAANVNLTDIQVRVRFERAGIVVEHNLSTLKLGQDIRK